MAGSDNKQKIMLTAAVLLFLVAGFLIYWFNFRKESIPTSETPAPPAATGTEGGTEPTPPPAPPPGGGRRTAPDAPPGGN